MRESLDDVSWKCLYMNEPIEREGLLFPADELNYYNGELPDGKPDRIVSWIDVAWGGGDYLAMPICYIYGEDVYVHDVVFNNGSKDVTYPLVAAKLQMHRPHKTTFEANNGGDVYADTIDAMLKQKDVRLNISSRRAPTTASKLSRIIQASPDIKRFFYKTKKTSDKFYNAFMKNLTSFMVTKKNKNDDAPDSLAGVCSMLYNRTGEASVRDRPF
jgi:predicted phage terminase large subunit-like protein